MQRGPAPGHLAERLAEPGQFQRFGAQRLNRATRFGQALAGQPGRGAEVPAPAGRVVGGLFGRLELGDDPGQALGQGVVDLPGHPLPLVLDPGLAGLGQQLLLQARVLGQRGLEPVVSRAQLVQRLPAPVVQQRGGPPGPGVGQRDGHVHGHDDEVDHHAGEGVLVDAVGLRGGGQQAHRGRAEQPPRPHQVPEHEEVDGERVDPEHGVAEDQERAERDQHRDEEHHHPRAAPPGGMQCVHPQDPRRGQRAQDEPGDPGVRARLVEGEGQQDAEDQHAVGQDIQQRVVTLDQRIRVGEVLAHGTGHLRPPH